MLFIDSCERSTYRTSNMLLQSVHQQPCGCTTRAVMRYNGTVLHMERELSGVSYSSSSLGSNLSRRTAQRNFFKKYCGISRQKSCTTHDNYLLLNICLLYYRRGLRHKFIRDRNEQMKLESRSSNLAYTAHYYSMHAKLCRCRQHQSWSSKQCCTYVSREENA